MSFAVLELCAGGGGQALGLEMAGFHHAGAVEYEPQFCTTLRKNRPHWNVIQQDIRHLRHQDFHGIDLLAAGVPCPPFSIASKQLGADDDRDMFPAALDMIEHIKPRAVLLENVPGFASAKFDHYRNTLLGRLSKMGYQPEGKILQASDYGVPQLRPRFVIVALAAKDAVFFAWPIETDPHETVGTLLVDLMAANGWPGAAPWAHKAAGIAPTIVGGSKKHGGPDLGPTRARSQWSMGIVRTTVERLNTGGNRDRKATLNPDGRDAIFWLFDHAPLPPQRSPATRPGKGGQNHGPKVRRKEGQRTLSCRS